MLLHRFLPKFESKKTKSGQNLAVKSHERKKKAAGAWAWRLPIAAQNARLWRSNCKKRLNKETCCDNERTRKKSGHVCGTGVNVPLLHTLSSNHLPVPRVGILPLLPHVIDDPPLIPLVPSCHLRKAWMLPPVSLPQSPERLFALPRQIRRVRVSKVLNNKASFNRSILPDNLEVRPSLRLKGWG